MNIFLCHQYTNVIIFKTVKGYSMADKKRSHMMQLHVFQPVIVQHLYLVVNVTFVCYWQSHYILCCCVNGSLICLPAIIEHRGTCLKPHILIMSPCRYPLNHECSHDGNCKRKFKCCEDHCGERHCTEAGKYIQQTIKSVRKDDRACLPWQ